MRAVLPIRSIARTVAVLAAYPWIGLVPAHAGCVTTTVAGATTARCSDGSRVTTTTVGGVTTNYYSDGSRSSDDTERGSTVTDRPDTRTSVVTREPSRVTTGGSTVLRSTYGGSGTRLP